jgi:DNA replication protein DnaC
MITTLSAAQCEPFGVQIAQLASLIDHPESNELVSIVCNDGRHTRARCETMIECRKIVSPFVACDPCIAKAAQDAATKMHKDYWESICPAQFRKTDVTRQDFPLAIYKEAKAIDPTKSLFLYGPSDTGKTRVAMLLLKRRLHLGKRVGILWPEKVSTLKTGYDDSQLEKYAAYDVLLMDDTLLAASRDSKLIENIRQLIDMRLRAERPFIFTSQIGSEDDLVKGSAFGDAKAADVERVKSLLKRLRSDCQIIPFAQAVPEDGEKPF